MPTYEELVAEVAGLSRRLDRVESVLAIQALKARYTELVDSRYGSGGPAATEVLVELADQAASLFTEDAVWDGGRGLGVADGRAAIADRLRTPTLSFARHFFGNPRIEVDGDRASGRWDLLSPFRALDGVSYWMWGYENDEYVRIDGAWLQSVMKLTTVFVAPAGEGWTRNLD